MTYSKSEAGQQAFKTRSALISPRQRSAFIMIDGVKSTEQLLTAVAGLGVNQGDLDYLMAQGFIVSALAPAPTTPVPSMDGADTAADEASVATDESADGFPTTALSTATLSPQQRYAAAYPLATQLTAKLGLRGFRLNLAVEAARGFDDLLALLPKIQDAVGATASEELAQILMD